MSIEDSGGKRRAKLGRGLSSLLGEDEDDKSQLDRLRQSKTVPIEQIAPGRFQPRRIFDGEEINALAESIREKGVLQPILLRRHPDDDDVYELIAGERRWRAAQIAQLHEIPALIREFDDRDALEIALIENIQRQDLTPIEEAEGFRRLIDEHGHSQEAIAQAIGKSRSHVANTLRLLSLPPTARAYLEEGKITAGHARALLQSEDPETLVEEIVAKGLTVRQAEERARGDAPSSRPPTPKAPSAPRTPATEKDPDILAAERATSAAIGLAVEIDSGDDGESGAVVVHYQSLEQLDLVLSRLAGAGMTAAAEPAPEGPIWEDPADLSEPRPDGDGMDFGALLAETDALLSDDDGEDDVRVGHPDDDFEDPATAGDESSGNGEARADGDDAQGETGSVSPDDDDADAAEEPELSSEPLKAVALGFRRLESESEDGELEDGELGGGGQTDQAAGMAGGDDLEDLEIEEESLEIDELDAVDLDAGDLDAGDLDVGDLDAGDLEVGELDMEEPDPEAELDASPDDRPAFPDTIPDDPFDDPIPSSSTEGAGGSDPSPPKPALDMDEGDDDILLMDDEEDEEDDPLIPRA